MKAVRPQTDRIYVEHPGLDHIFVGVAGHPDDGECTFREDGTDATYCGLPAWRHGEWGEYVPVPSEPKEEQNNDDE